MQESASCLQYKKSELIWGMVIWIEVKLSSAQSFCAGCWGVLHKLQPSLTKLGNWICTHSCRASDHGILLKSVYNFFIDTDFAQHADGPGDPTGHEDGDDAPPSDAEDEVWMNFSRPPLEVVTSTSAVGKFVNMSFRPWSLKTSPCHRDRFQLELRYASIVLYWSLFDWNCPCMLFRTPVWVGRTETCITFNINIIIQVASNWNIPDDVCIINLWLLSLAKFIYLLLKSLRHCCYNTACPLGNTDCQVYIYHMTKKKL